MTTHTGRNGSVKLGANAVAEVTAWSLTETGDQQEDHAMGDTWKTRKPTFNDFSGQITCYWDPSDLNGQGGLAINAGIDVDLYPDGESPGDTHYNGPAIVSQIVHQAQKDGMIETTFNYVGNGELAREVVA